MLRSLSSACAHVPSCEDRLTVHARGDLRELWATVPGEAQVIDLNSDGSPDLASERQVPARDVAVGTNVFVKAGQQVRRLSVLGSQLCVFSCPSLLCDCWVGLHWVELGWLEALMLLYLTRALESSGQVLG